MVRHRTGRPRNVRLAIGLALGLACVLLGPIEVHATAHGSRVEPHRAIYKLTEIEMGDSLGQNLQGTLTYELEGSACSGFTVRSNTELSLVGDDKARHRFLEGQVLFEDPKLGILSFDRQTLLDDRLLESVKGQAEQLQDKTVQVYLQTSAKGQASSFPKVENALFPIAFVDQLIARATRGEESIDLVLFDGSSPAGAAYHVTGLILPAVEGRAGGHQPERIKASVAAWDFDLSYTSLATGSAVGADVGASGRGQHSHHLSFGLSRSGVMSNIIMDDGTVMLHGSLTDLDMLAKEDCL